MNGVNYRNDFVMITSPLIVSRVSLVLSLIVILVCLMVSFERVVKYVFVDIFLLLYVALFNVPTNSCHQTVCYFLRMRSLPFNPPDKT